MDTLIAVVGAQGSGKTTLITFLRKLAPAGLSFVEGAGRRGWRNVEVVRDGALEPPANRGYTLRLQVNFLDDPTESKAAWTQHAENVLAWLQSETDLMGSCPDCDGEEIP